MLFAGSILSLPEKTYAANPNSCVFLRDLSIGATGADVLNLQRTLNATATTRVNAFGPGSPNNETTYYGPATANAVSRFQAKNNLVANGYFNSATRAKLIPACTKLLPVITNPKPTTPKPTTPTTEGDFQIKSQSDRNVELGLLDTGIIVEAELRAKGSDMKIDRLDLVLSQKPERFFKSIDIELDGKTVSTINIDKKSYDKSNNEYKLRFNLKDALINKDDEGVLLIKATTLKSIKTSDINKEVLAKINSNSIRVTDSAKLTSTLPSNSFDPVVITFAKNKNAGELKVINQNSDRTAVIKQNQITKDIVLNQFSLTGKKQSSKLQEMYVQVNLFDLNPSSIRKLSLFVDNKLVDSQTLVAATSDINVKNSSSSYVVIPSEATYVKFKIPKINLDDAKLADFQIRAELDKDLALTENSAIEVVVRDIRGKDSNNKDVILSDLKIGLNNETFLVNTGLRIEADNITESSRALGRESKTAEYRLTIPVTALESDIIINPNAYTTFSYAIINSMGNTIETGSNISAVLDSNARKNNLSNYIIYEGQTKNLELVVAYNNTSAIPGFYSLVVTEINYFDSSGNQDKAIIRKNNKSDYIYLN